MKSFHVLSGSDNIAFLKLSSYANSYYHQMTPQLEFSNLSAFYLNLY